jgi:hypothetical protein
MNAGDIPGPGRPFPFFRAPLYLLLLLAACAPPVWNPQVAVEEGPPLTDSPFVHQDGTRLVDGTGAPITLRGVNLGGWLLWEGWIWGGGWQGERELVSRFTELLGADEAGRFVDRVHDEFIREEDIARIAALGMSSVRVPFNHALLEDDAAPFVYKQRGWEVLDRLLDWCEAHQVYAVLDLHAAPGGQSGFYMSDPDSTKLWDSESNRDRTVALWKAIAERYRDRRIIAGYDLLNEPGAPGGPELFDLYRRITAAIREVDPHHLIIVEGASVASDFAIFTSPLSRNQAYSFHMYTWFGDPRRDELAKYKAVSQAHGIPMWNGEFGEGSVELITSTAALYSEPDYGLSGFSFWTWKKVPNGSAHLAGMTQPMPRWKKLISWVANGWNARPTVEEAREGMDEFFAASRIASCEMNEEVAAAFRGSP